MWVGSKRDLLNNKNISRWQVSYKLVKIATSWLASYFLSEKLAHNKLTLARWRFQWVIYTATQLDILDAMGMRIFCKIITLFCNITLRQLLVFWVKI